MSRLAKNKYDMGAIKDDPLSLPVILFELLILFQESTQITTGNLKIVITLL